MRRAVASMAFLVLFGVAPAEAGAADEPVRIGSKADTESTILGEICEKLLRARGPAPLVRRSAASLSTSV